MWGTNLPGDAGVEGQVGSRAVDDHLGRLGRARGIPVGREEPGLAASLEDVGARSDPIGVGLRVARSQVGRPRSPHDVSTNLL